MKWTEIPWDRVLRCPYPEDAAPTTAEDIARVEADIGFAFPDPFKRFMKAFRPGSMRLGINPRRRYEEPFLIHMLDRIDRGWSVYAARLDWDPPWPEGVFPFGDDAGGWLLCIDLREDGGYGYGEVIVYRGGMDDEDEDDLDDGETPYRFCPLGRFDRVAWFIND